MDDSDQKKLYEVAELQEYQEEIGFKKYAESSSSPGTTTSRQSLMQCLSPVFYLVFFVLLILGIIMQAAVIYLVLHIPESEITTTAEPTTAAPTSSGFTGGEINCNCNYTDNSDLLNQIIASTKDIPTFNALQWQYIQNITDSLQANFQYNEQSSLYLSNIITTLSLLIDNSVTTEVVVNDIEMLINILLQLQNASTALYPTSCQDIKNNDPNSTSGYYHINSQIVYCEMGSLCNSTEGGWTRLGLFDMSDATIDCPAGFKLYTNGNVRACGRPGNQGSCESIKLETNGIGYTEICGRVEGYQYASPDTFHFNQGIDSTYVDGVSITQGYPRQHVWTFINGLSDTISYPASVSCPCNTGVNRDLNPFIGNDYSCESGNHGYWSYTLYTDALWDGKDCGNLESDCCSAPGVPWFHKTFNSSSTEYVEVRVCGNQTPVDEDTPIGLYEIYVK